MRIQPFRPLIPSSNEAANELTCPPYDVLSASEARSILSENPNSFLRVTRPDASHPAGTANEVLYRSAKGSLTDLEANSSLIRERSPSLYIYAQTSSGRTQYGLVALVHADDYVDNIIRRHERTRPDKEADRTNLTDTLSANVGPVFLTYRDDPAVDRVIAESVLSDPLFSVSVDDPSQHVVHRVWRVPAESTDKLVQLVGDTVPVSYIADGHHRAASAANVAVKRRTQGAGGEDGDAHDYDCFLAVMFPASQLNILAYNRLVSDLNGHTPSQFLAELRSVGDLSEMQVAPSDVPDTPGVAYMFLEEAWHRLDMRGDHAEDHGDVSDSLDCAVLQRKVLAPLLGIRDPRKSKRIDFVGGVKGVGFLEDCVRKGVAAVAFALHPVNVTQLMDVADRGEIMPPKSTWFEPKLRSGFFVHSF